MEEKEKIIFTIFGIVAIIAVVGLIGIFNKPTYILIQPQDLEARQTPESGQAAISGMTVYSPSREACLRYKSIYGNYAWFDDWEWFNEQCKAKYDLSEPNECEAKYLDEYQCNGNFIQRKIQTKRCDTGWREFQYCENGCFGGKCKEASEACAEKYLYNYQCYNGNSQRLHQDTNCRTEYIDYEICKSGCNENTGTCNKETKQLCAPGFIDDYKCSGQYLQRAYQYSNCLKTYFNAQFCTNGCSDNKCN